MTSFQVATALALTALAACAIGVLGLCWFVRLLRGRGKWFVDWLWRRKRGREG